MISEEEIRRTYEFMKDTLERHGFHVEMLQVEPIHPGEENEHLHMTWIMHLPSSEVSKNAVSGTDPLQSVVRAFSDDAIPAVIAPALNPMNGDTGRVALFHMSAPMNACVRMLQANEAHPEAQFN